MASLTESAYHTRKIINYGIIAVIVFIILKIIWTIAVNVWITGHPPAPPPPNMAYGKLPLVAFSDSCKNYDLAFKLETISGNFPESSPSARVYFMPILSANLLSMERADDKAKKMGFTLPPNNLSKEEYQWFDELNPLRSLTVNIVTGNLKLSYDYTKDLSLLQDKNLPLKEDAIEEAKNTLDNYNLLNDDLRYGEIKVANYKLVNNALQEVSGVAEADFVKVQFLRSKVNEASVLTPGSNETPASVIFSGSNDAIKRIIELKYNYQLIDLENFATYPIKNPQLAYDELKKTKGCISDQGSLDGKERTIRNIYLSYYDSLTLQAYLQPIYVFEGDKGFRSYVPAVTDDWLELPAK